MPSDIKNIQQSLDEKDFEDFPSYKRLRGTKGEDNNRETPQRALRERRMEHRQKLYDERNMNVRVKTPPIILTR